MRLSIPLNSHPQRLLGGQMRRLPFSLISLIPLILLFSFITLITLFPFSACAKNTPSQPKTFRKDAVLKIISQTGEEQFWDIELADTDAKRVMGLMNRYTMEPQQGMLFIFDYEEIQTFWMKNTYLSLDMLFISADFRIVQIHENAFPLHEDLISSNVRAKYVLEILGGMASKSGISVGDVVEIMNYEL